MKKILTCLLCLFLVSYNAAADSADSIIQFIFTSDVHYGIARNNFRGKEKADAHVVNLAMIEQMNRLPRMLLPRDEGVRAGKPVKWIDYLVITGDITNRQEPPYPSAAVSWKQFTEDYSHQLAITGRKGKNTSLLLVPGNHDVTNAIGSFKEMNPKTDPTAMVGIYNLMMRPATPLTNDRFDYQQHKVNYSRNIAGMHFIFLTIWPDTIIRNWLEKDLSGIQNNTPVFIFTHDPPEGDKKHFTNPFGRHDMNAADNFENLLTEYYQPESPGDPQSRDANEKAFVSFLKAHPNIKAYFHGHSNYKEFYIYRGPEKNIALPCFRADSPMKGKYSAVDETKLSFQLVTIDTHKKQITARECLWNTEPGNPLHPIVWGDAITVSF